ncbi:transcriptional regulator, TetR family [Rhodoblastus acidophilus]|uniref:Transcriptional regulator, TetR family n=1 Tax=Rhodoblastus acidophilus TaxID=1074 RepID=A0A212QM71_RHOAC|nr:TetR/AcrR family transcriptional regulator [Rhodoblastus acidophilus]MCW2317714.1 AcrR family transcriptional regulator [Rhodoblastus acidophilus]PPQ36182.1 TetR/AcrR family transcriptional regulator [Rhodoblastus acidophilus]RAI23780.1 TetR/AcrR family transcriptional regulator [Rhodoblastus acidophilus]SNB60406.1 transcriptional regulator, TetR family [Rhodoblastus acidophilus]
MTKAEDRRGQQRERLIETAEATIAASGHDALKARELAAAVGVSLGGLYNLVGDLDELMLLVSARTLRRLDAALSAAATNDDPAERLVAIALAYCRFARDNQALWRALFDHRFVEDKPLPDWHARTQLGLFLHLAEPLRRIAPHKSDEQRQVLARTWFSAVHGVVLLGIAEMLVAVPYDALEAQIAEMVRMLCAGAERT